MFPSLLLFIEVWPTRREDAQPSIQDRAACDDHTCDVIFQGGASYETEFNGTPPFTPTRLDGLRAIGSWPGAGSSQVVLTILQLDSLVTVVVVGYFMVRSFT